MDLKFPSFEVLGRWTWYLGYCFVIRFILRVFLIIDLAPGFSAPRAWTIVELLAMDVALFLLPAIVCFVISRRVEDGYISAFTIACTVTVWAAVATVIDFLFRNTQSEFSNVNGRVEVFLLFPVVRIFAAILVAWPDIMENIRARRRRNQPQGFAPIILPAAGPVPIPVQNEFSQTQETKTPPQPRYIPESMVRAAHLIKGIGYVIIAGFILAAILTVPFASGSDNPLQTAIFGWLYVAATWLIPGFLFRWLSRHVDAGWPWAVTCSMTLAALLIGGQMSNAIVSTRCYPAVESFLITATIFSSILCGLILIVCMFVWRDARHVRRTLARDRLYDQPRTTATPIPPPRPSALPRPRTPASIKPTSSA